MVSPALKLEDSSRSRPWRSFGDEEEDGDGVDQFDRLPDSLILVILNFVGDVKVLGRCSAASRRFRSLVPLVEEVVVCVDCVISDEPPSTSGSSSSSIASVDKTRGILSHLARLVLGPLQTLGQILLFNNSSTKRSYSDLSPSSSQVSHHSPAEVLKNFREIRRLRIELPAGELGVDDGVLLKWKASFGSTLNSCVILGAASESPNPNPNPNPSHSPSPDESGSMPESFYTNGSLKLRVVWTISSLIAASARHYLLQPIITDHQTLESLELTDADGQGTLVMDAGQLRELWTRPVSASGSSQRTLVPALSMKLWYASEIEIPGGVMLKGATLVAIRPSEEEQQQRPPESARDGGCWVSNAFEEPFRTAAKMLVRRMTYSLEMNSF